MQHGSQGNLVIRDSYNIGEIKKETVSICIGGIAGTSNGYNNSNVVFENCYNLGIVQSGGESGAFYGARSSLGENSVLTFNNCYWTPNSGVEYGSYTESFREQLIMMDDDLVELANKLGGEFVYDQKKEYPVLKWQVE